MLLKSLFAHWMTPRQDILENLCWKSFRNVPWKGFSGNNCSLTGVWKAVISADVCFLRSPRLENLRALATTQNVRWETDSFLLLPYAPFHMQWGKVGETPASNLQTLEHSTTQLNALKRIPGGFSALIIFVSLQLPAFHLSSKLLLWLTFRRVM